VSVFEIPLPPQSGRLLSGCCWAPGAKKLPGMVGQNPSGTFPSGPFGMPPMKTRPVNPFDPGAKKLGGRLRSYQVPLAAGLPETLWNRSGPAGMARDLVSETNVVFGGRTSVIVTPVAVFGPALWIWIV